MRINYLLKVLVTTALVVAVPTFPTAQTKIVSPDSRTNFSVWGVPQNMGTAVNSIDNESAAAVSPNGLSLYVSSNKSGSIGSIDIWVSQRPTLSSAWGTVQNLGQPVNSSSNENLPVLSADGTTMFFNCSCPDQFGGADIYMTTRTDPNNDAGWRTPVNLGPVINTPDAEWGAGYFEDPTNGTAVLYFTSDRAGGLGANDIYQSTRNADGTFNPPTNVTELNSSSFERNATVSHDGLEIYLTSDRDGGLGDRDIWVSTRASLPSSGRAAFDLRTDQLSSNKSKAFSTVENYPNQESGDCK